MPRKSLARLSADANTGDQVLRDSGADLSPMASIGASIDDARLYRRKFVQKQIGIGTTKFYELVKRGEIETCKIGAATVVPGYSLRRFIEKTIAA